MPYDKGSLLIRIHALCSSAGRIRGFSNWLYCRGLTARTAWKMLSQDNLCFTAVDENCWAGECSLMVLSFFLTLYHSIHYFFLSVILTIVLSFHHLYCSVCYSIHHLSFHQLFCFVCHSIILSILYFLLCCSIYHSTILLFCCFVCLSVCLFIYCSIHPSIHPSSVHCNRQRCIPSPQFTYLALSQECLWSMFDKVE